MQGVLQDTAASGSVIWNKEPWQRSCHWLNTKRRDILLSLLHIQCCLNLDF